jgi:hypothetical protein
MRTHKKHFINLILRLPPIIISNDKKHLLDVLEHQLIGINLDITKSKCENEKKYLHRIKDIINHLKNKLI